MEPIALLGGLTADQFLREYWQKKPLLVRNALPEFRGVVDRDRVMALACEDEVESRFVEFDGQKWRVKHGPFQPATLKRRRNTLWTVLVQGLNLHEPAADELLRSLPFMPYARLDDLMVSYAVPGGGVGPHFDSYDVFLIQGAGRRRWEISAQTDLDILPDAPLRILARFEPEQSWIVEPGDLLYLPPRFAHNGVALDECLTFSIGFRAPTTQEFAFEFLSYLQDHLQLEGRYEDPDLERSDHPAALGEAMIARVSDMLSRITWSPETVADFLGRYQSEPKPHIFFDPPEKPLARRQFAKACASGGILLDPRSIMLFHGNAFYINGERYDAVDAEARSCLEKLADRRRTEPGDAIAQSAHGFLYECYRAGYLWPRTA